mgnify:CR=1 FL=1
MTTGFARCAFVALAVLVVACIDTTSPSFVNQGQSNGAGGGGGGGTGNVDTALVGSWVGPTTQDTVNGHAQNVNTAWTFTADGSVLRQVVTLDMVTGIADTVISSGTWTGNGSSLSVSFTTPNAENLSFSYTVAGSLLTLDQVQYVRTG